METKTDKPKRLTIKQKRYAKLRADGEPRAKAYKGAGYSDRQTDASADGNAKALERRTPDILLEIDRLRRLAEQGAIMDRQQRQVMLTELAQDRDGSRSDRLKALDLLNKMSGDYSERIIYEGKATVSVEDVRRQAWDELRGE